MCPIRPILLSLALAAFVGAGCSSVTNTAPVAQALPPAKSYPFEQIAQGMTAEQVRALVGRPDVVTPMPHEDVKAEAWLYQRKLDEEVRLVPVSMKQVPAFNIFTGAPITVEEPVLQDGFTTLYEDFNLLLVDDRVSAISRRQRVEQKIR